MIICRSFAVVAFASLVLGGCASRLDAPPKKQAHVYPNLSTCFGLNIDFHFVAERYERPWRANNSPSFTFANLFHFALASEIERNVASARLQLDAADSPLQVVFSSSSSKIVVQRILREAHVDCTEERTIVKYMDSVHGGDGFGGSDRTITVTFKPTDGLAHATSRLEGVSRSYIFFMFPVPIKPVETWAQFRAR